MSKIIRNLSTPEGRAFWKSVEKSAAEVLTWPDWKRAGINVSDLRDTPRTIEKENIMEFPEHIDNLIAESLKLRGTLEALVSTTQPRIRSTANGFRYCVSCGKEWSHDSPKEEHKPDCALVAAKQLLKELNDY